MTITFPHPHISRPDFVPYAIAGVAILAMAGAVTGILAAADDGPAASAPATAEVSGLSTPAHTFVGPSSNYYNSLDSLGPAVTQPNSFSEADRMAAAATSLGIVPVEPTFEMNSFSEADRMAAAARSLGIVPASPSSSDVTPGLYVDLSPLAAVLTPANSFSEADWKFADAGALGVVPEG